MKKIILLSIITFTYQGCGIYSFTGGDTGDAKTFQVNYFQNNAQLLNQD